MESKHPRPSHASYRVHRRQAAWQILLPVIVAFLLLILAGYLIARATFSAGGDVGRWAAISTMWLSLPVMLGGLILLLLLIGVTYIIGRLAGLIPRYSYPAQKYAGQMVEVAKRVEHIGHRPMTIFPEIGRLIRTIAQRVRRG